jgi:nucleotide-binding universal stress UspA family protein
MTSSPLSVLCPIDFSEASLGALRYAAAIAESSHGPLMVMTVDDPLLASMDAARGHAWPSDQTRKDLESAVTDTLGLRAHGLDLHYHVPIGEPAPEILRVAAERRVDLIVMSSHGLTGVRKLFFGSTTERVLRRAPVPVLVTRPGDRGPAESAEIASRIGRILVPIDLAGAPVHQVRIAHTLADRLGSALLVTHVVEPTRLAFPRRADGPKLDAERRAQAQDLLDALVADHAPGDRVETLIAYGDPAEEIVRIAKDRHAGLIVMPLSIERARGPLVGSVTYRVLCLANSLVLALPAAMATPTSMEQDLSSAHRS